MFWKMFVFTCGLDKMGSTMFLYTVVILSSIWPASSTACTITDRIECTYTVVCNQHAGSANNPSCDYDPYVNFVMRDSSVDTLTTGFFGATNFDSRVRRFHAINNVWPNIEAFAFKYYTKCLEMDLSNNNIKNLKNDAFKNLFVLDFLNLSQNAIERINTGAFAISEVNSNKLATLDLSNNLLREIPSEALSKVPGINRLYLQNNKLKSLAEDCFSGLKNLTTLNLQNNQLTAINLTLIHLKSLKTLDLSFNNLIKLVGFELNRLESIMFLNISYNAIGVIESNCFNQAFSLVSVDLSNNKIKSSIDNVMFINNNKLTHLNVSNNSIEHIQDDAFKHNIVTSLNLEKNNMNGDITGKTLEGTMNVQRLDLSNQSISAIREGAFVDLIRLTYLNLSRNNIDTFEPSRFILPNLNIMDISYNNLSNLDFLKDSAESLTELYVNNNNLTAIKIGTFENQTNLKKLDLSMNFIVTIEQNSLPLLNLQYFNVSGNLLTGSLKSNVVSPSKFLRFLDLSSFNFKRIEDGAFVDSPVLARVNLSHNAIEFIGATNFMNMDNLYSLDLSYNRITKLELNTSLLLNLKALYLNNNQLEHVDCPFLNISNVLYLDISDNDITDISDPIFNTLHDLRVLRVSNNKLKQFNNPQINSLTKLMTLSISSNSLANLNLSFFPDLVNVDLSNNSINFINSSFFQNLGHLQSIDLSLNNITKLTPGTFQSLKILKLLNLSSNSISNLRYGSFKGLGRAEVIDISRNAIKAFDVDIFHECTELKLLILDYNFITQLDFERLVMTVTKLNTLSLGGNPILCKEIVRNYNSGIGGRRVEVTSIDKVFEEDNVHGILCGNGTVATTATSIVSPTEASSQSAVSALFIWCSVLTILLLAVGAAAYFYKRNRIVVIRESSSMRSTAEFGGSDNQSELLF